MSLLIRIIILFKLTFMSVDSLDNLSVKYMKNLTESLEYVKIYNFCREIAAK